MAARWWCVKSRVVTHVALPGCPLRCWPCGGAFTTAASFRDACAATFQQLRNLCQECWVVAESVAAPLERFAEECEKNGTIDIERLQPLVLDPQACRGRRGGAGGEEGERK